MIARGPKAVCKLLENECWRDSGGDRTYISVNIIAIRVLVIESIKNVIGFCTPFRLKSPFV